MNRIPLSISPMTWVKSSYSNGDGGGCVEWAPSATTTGAVPVRDSKEPTGPVLSFTSHGWTTFVTAVKRDNFTA